MSVTTSRVSGSLAPLEEAAQSPVAHAGHTSMWLVALAPPLLALLNLRLSSAMAPWSCRTGDHVLINTSTALLLVAVCICGLNATRQIRHDWAAKEFVSLAGLMAMLGVLSSALSAGAIASQWLEIASVAGCR